jgi:hypothetical protein
MIPLTLVTLSDGTTATVYLPRSQIAYYPDVPHCTACDLRQRPGMTFYQCDAPRRGSRYGGCRRYVCAACVVRQDDKAYCAKCGKKSTS